MNFPRKKEEEGNQKEEEKMGGEGEGERRGFKKVKEKEYEKKNNNKISGKGRGGDIRFECKVVVQVLGHDGIVKGEGGVGEDFRWMVLGGEKKGGGVVVDFVVGGEVGEGVGG